MKRNKKTEKHKEFLRLEREMYANWEAQRKLGYKPLDKPIHHGYDAYWVLRDDVSRRDDADRFQYILDTYGTTVWCRKKDFKSWNYLYKREVDIKPGFKEINPREYDELSPWVKKFFDSYTRYTSWGKNSYIMYRVNIPDYFLVRKREKSYKTHYKVIDELLKQEEAELESKLENQFYDERRKSWNRHRSGKSYRKIFSKADRSYNKMALYKNMNFIFAKYDDIHDDWGSWTNEWCDDAAEFKYYHNHYGRWWF